MTDIQTLKKDIRKQALSRRDELTEEARTMFSQRISNAFFELDIAPGVMTSAFLPIKTEVDLNGLIKDMWDQKRDICLPYMLDKAHIEFRSYDAETKLVDNGFGTVAPYDASDVVDPDWSKGPNGPASEPHAFGAVDHMVDVAFHGASADLRCLEMG